MDEKKQDSLGQNQPSFGADFSPHKYLSISNGALRLTPGLRTKGKEKKVGRCQKGSDEQKYQDTFVCNYLSSHDKAKEKTRAGCQKKKHKSVNVRFPLRLLPLSRDFFVLSVSHPELLLPPSRICCSVRRSDCDIVQQCTNKRMFLLLLFFRCFFSKQILPCKATSSST